MCSCSQSPSSPYALSPTRSPLVLAPFLASKSKKQAALFLINLQVPRAIHTFPQAAHDVKRPARVQLYSGTSPKKEFKQKRQIQAFFSPGAEVVLVFRFNSVRALAPDQDWDLVWRLMPFARGQNGLIPLRSNKLIKKISRGFLVYSLDRFFRLRAHGIKRHTRSLSHRETHLINGPLTPRNPLAR